MAEPDHLYVDLQTPEFDALFRNAPLYRKIVKVKARWLTEDEDISTVLADGTVETTRRAPAGHWKVENPGGETYVVEPDEFASRYDPTDELGIYQAKGMIRVVPNTTGSPVQIDAPWGEPQFGAVDCQFAEPVQSVGTSGRRYIIGRAELDTTYTHVPVRTSLEVVAAAVTKYPEMSWLTGDVQTTPALGVAASAGATLGEQIFPALSRPQVAEFDRTAVGLLALRWVLNNDYESFTACQPEATALSRPGFDALRQYTLEFVRRRDGSGGLDQGAVDALETFIVINDLGKIERIVDSIAARTGVRDVDHDKLLAAGLAADPQISPSFTRLAPQYQAMILRGLQTEFNIGQFVQGENVPASLEKLHGIDPDSLRLYLLHSLYDVAGAAGQFVQNGSMVMTEPTYRNFGLAFDALEQLTTGARVETVYDEYLAARGRKVGLDTSNLRERAVTRVCCMLRISNPALAQRIARVYNGLTPNTQAILDKDLNINGTSDGVATLVYYAPAVLANLQKTMAAGGDSTEFDRAVEVGLTTLARVFQEARIANKGKQGNGVFTVMASNIARAAGEDPDRLVRSELSLVQVGNDAEVHLADVPTIHHDRFPLISDLSQIPGQRVAVVGIGGGSDCIQAAAVAKLLERSGKESACVISVRTEKTRSQSTSGRIGEKRTVTNHGGQISDGVYAITPETTGSGRFLENIAAAEIPTFLVVERERERE